MVMLIGADRLGNISGLLRQRGFSSHVHITGRNPSAQRGCGRLEGTKLMILFTDFVGHNVMRKFRRLAKANAIPFVACRRSVVSVSKALDKLQGQEACCVGCDGCRTGG